MTEHRSVATVPATHPCLAGHFPGRPIVPAVVILESVMEAVRDLGRPPCKLRSLDSVKFLQPLLPGVAFDIVLQQNDCQLSFRCERDGQLLAQGRGELA